MGQEVQLVKEMPGTESPVRRKYSRVVEQGVQSGERGGSESPVRKEERK